MFDPKLAAGGTLIFLLSGGGGFIASSEISSAIKTDAEIEEEQDLLELASEESSAEARSSTGKTKTIKEKIKEYKFSLIKEEGKTEDEVQLKILSDATKISEENLKSFCNQKVDLQYEKQKNWTVLKESIKKCSKLVTFSERASQLNVELIEKEADWTTRFGELKNGKLQTFADYTSVLITSWDSKNLNIHDLKNFCETVGNLDWTKIEKTRSTKQEFSNYLEACAKNKNSDFSFWTGKQYKKFLNNK